MSPLSLRRQRAERTLREQFEALRGRVLASVRGRLRASGATLDHADLEAAYALAWQGLYTALLEGQEIANPVGWLVLVTHRRALDEHRARASSLVGRTHSAAHAGGAVDPDLPSELDDRDRLRQLFEGMRGRLDAREREAAALCYLQGLSRSQAAARMGLSERRMRKLMEGRQGVAGKVGALVRTISDGDWCDEQGSLMRALAFGLLDPTGERHRLALAHSSQCPSCRAYVVSLRGLAVVLPPVFLPGGLCAAALASIAEGIAGGSAAGAAAGTGAGAGGAVGAGGAAGGGWLLGAGPSGAKFAVGCLLALGVGAGCTALEASHHASPAPRTRGHARSRRNASGPSDYGLESAAVGTSSPRAAAASALRASVGSTLTPVAKASREFGPEQRLGGGSERATVAGAAGAAGARPTARIASSRSTPSDAGPPEGTATPPSSAHDSAAAEREFSPG
jgi:RNA polymerase sigma factor (sigma-70 family)